MKIHSDTAACSDGFAQGAARAAGLEEAQRQHQWHRRRRFRGSEVQVAEIYAYVAFVLVTPLALSALAAFALSDLTLIERFVIGATAFISIGDACILVCQRLSYLTPTRRTKMGPRSTSETVAVAMSCIPSDVLEAQRVLASCDQIASGIDCPNTLLVVLADLPDAPEPVLQADHAIIEMLTEGINARNAARKVDSAPRFILLGRNRSWSTGERAWICRDRKRQKVMDLAMAMIGASWSFSWQAGPAELLKEASFVLTIDEDSRLTPGCLDSLVAAARAPESSASHDPSGNVIGGHGMFVPRLMPRTASEGHPMDGLYRHSHDLPQRLITVFDGIRYVHVDASPGSNVAPAAGGSARDIHYDLFGMCLYTGKGLFRPETLCRALAEKLPADRILSHDILETAFLRPAYVDQAIVTETEPSSTLGKLGRSHRWMRGDWQNVFHQLHAPPRPRSEGRRFLYLTLLDQARNNLTAPSALALMLLCAMLCQGYEATAGVALVVFSPILAEVFGLIVDAFEVSVGLAPVTALNHAFDRRVAASVRRMRELPGLALRAVVALDAMFIAGIRWVQGRRLLEWTPSSSTGGKKTRIFSLARATALLLSLGGLCIVVIEPFAGALLISLAIAPFLVWRNAHANDA